MLNKSNISDFFLKSYQINHVHVSPNFLRDIKQASPPLLGAMVTDLWTFHYQFQSAMVTDLRTFHYRFQSARHGPYFYCAEKLRSKYEISVVR